MQRSTILLAILFLLQIGFCVGDTLPTCITNPNTSTSTTFNKIFNGCYRDETKYYVPYYISAQIQDWLDNDLFFQYVLLAILIIPAIAFYESDHGEGEFGQESTARANRTRLSGIMLLFRVGLGTSLTLWLHVVIQQQRPCICGGQLIGSEDGIWGMPSVVSVTSTIIGAHVLEHISIPAGIVIPIAVCAARVLLGYHSVGQVLAGIALGTILHFYATRTPIFVRFIDFILNLLAGLLILFLIKANHQSVDFSFSNTFLIGIVWQIFSLTFMIGLYDWTFVKVALKKPIHHIDVPDFLYYMPLNRPSAALNPTGRHELKIVGLCISVLFVALTVVRAVTPYLDSILLVNKH